MRNKMSAGFSNCFMFIVVGFMVFSNWLVAKAQNNSAVKLVGTEWTTGETIVPTAYLDNSITTVTRYLVFYKQGKVKATIVLQKSIGVKTETVTEYVNESYYSGATDRYEYRTVPIQVQKSVNTPGDINREVWEGNYEIKGKTIYLNFPNFSIEANISGNWLKGITAYKGSNEKEAWILSPLTSSQNTPSSGNSNLGNLRENRTSDLAGNWEGTYSCGQGLTNLNLSISQSNSSEVSAVFKFSANRSNPSVPSGSYRMVGTYDNKTNKIILRATDWISQPSGYVTVDLVGTISQGNTTMSGEIINSICTTFTLEKK